MDVCSVKAVGYYSTSTESTPTHLSTLGYNWHIILDYIIIMLSECSIHRIKCTYIWWRQPLYIHTYILIQYTRMHLYDDVDIPVVICHHTYLSLLQYIYISTQWSLLSTTMWPSQKRLCKWEITPRNISLSCTTLFTNPIHCIVKVHKWHHHISPFWHQIIVCFNSCDLHIAFIFC